MLMYCYCNISVDCLTPDDRVMITCHYEFQKRWVRKDGQIVTSFIIPKYFLINRGELYILSTSGHTSAHTGGLATCQDPENENENWWLPVGGMRMLMVRPKWQPKEQWRRKITQDKISNMINDVHTRTALGRLRSLKTYQRSHAEKKISAWRRDLISLHRLLCFIKVSLIG